MGKIAINQLTSNCQLEAIITDNIQGFMYAEGGAMGKPGEIKFFCIENNKPVLYKGNRFDDGINSELVESIFSKLFNKCEWFYVYLGMGNHLFMNENFQAEFEAARNKLDKHIYKAYEEIMVGIISRHVDGACNLERFLLAQEKMYEIALEEIREGRKRSHWMWYIFPQLKGLGYSAMAQKYAIENIDEAKAYLEHPILSSRLIEITEALLELNEQNPELIFGYTDSLKLRSSMTLFAYISPKRSSVFRKVIEKYFYGDVDERTYKMLQEESEHTD